MFAFRGRWLLTCALAILAGPVTAVGQDAVDLTGEVRSRFEFGDVAGGDADGFTLLRTRLGLTAEPLDYARIFAQVQDSRIWGQEASTLEGSADAFDLHQGYVELSRNVAEHDLKLRVGRQEIALGNERLVGAVGWSNVGRSFDGARLDIGGPGGWWSVSGLVATIAESGLPPTGQGDGARVRSFGDHTFAGVFVDLQEYDLYAFQDLNDRERAFTNQDRTTVGARVDRAEGRLSYEFEGAYQFGDQAVEAPSDPGPGPLNQDVSAWMATGRIALEMTEGTGPLRGLGIGLDWLSGDPDGRNAARGDYEAFNVLFHTGHKWYGYMDFFGNPAARTNDRGLVDAMATVRTAWGETHRIPVAATLHRFSLAEDAGLPDSEIGWELDVTAPYALGDAGSVQAGYSAFFAGDAAPAIALADADETRHWFYLQFTLGF